MLKFGGSVSQDCRIDQSYFSAHRREDEPHVIIMLEHFYEGNENISRAEVLVALAAMVTQMEHDYLESHCIAPVSYKLSICLPSRLCPWSITWFCTSC